MAYENIVVKTRGRVGLITLNRRKQLNALDDALMDELRDALTDFDRDDAIGAIVLLGSEKAFAAGADVSAMKVWSYMDVYKTNFITRNWESLRSVRKPRENRLIRLRADYIDRQNAQHIPMPEYSSDSRQV
jgi:enoyl-CoA hydratase